MSYSLPFIMCVWGWGVDYGKNKLRHLQSIFVIFKFPARGQ